VTRVRREFVRRVLAEVAPHGSMLTVCAGPDEPEVLPEATHSSIETGQDAQALPYADGSFDWVFVSDGLHHCSQPHRALAEMYRVARQGLIVVEASDNPLTRLAVHWRLTQEYELEAVAGNRGEGGVDNTAVPNYIYRWNEREFEKTLRSLDPNGPIRFDFFYELVLPPRFGPLRRLQRPAAFVLRRWTNAIAMVAQKPETRWPWLISS
jgi:SAM-dependent methyltransferase